MVVIWFTPAPDELDDKLRDVIAKLNKLKNQKAFKKGDLKATVLWAVEEWIEKQNKFLESQKAVV